ncbi:MAG: aminotransferase class V-fold PLP-dependent enzyme [Candidatus Hydrogenedentes bacterium]|nr:aminotransferase class V-fold PLP-dependent enzyme [Candidatus Hydrogenedentota bacterium]
MKERLFTPGPTPVPPEVLLAMAAPMTHHRQAAFEKLFASVSEKLKTVFQTKSLVVILAGSGTSAMEGSIVNLLSAGDKALSVNGGKFGERWGQIGKAYGVNMQVLDVPWGEAVDPARIETALKADPSTCRCWTCRGARPSIRRESKRRSRPIRASRRYMRPCMKPARLS